MGPAGALPTLNHLRQMLARVDPTLGPRLPEPERVVTLGFPPSMTSSAAGLARPALHEFAPAEPIHLAAATGFAMALAARMNGARGEMLWIATDFALGEGGGPYGPGLDLFGLASSAAPGAAGAARRPTCSGPWRRRCAAARSPASSPSCRAMRGGRTHGVAQALARRARERNLGPPAAPSRQGRRRARLRPAGRSRRPERARRLRRARPQRASISLCKNRRGPAGRWIIEWDHHAYVFHAAVSLPVAEAALDRPDRAARLSAAG